MECILNLFVVTMLKTILEFAYLKFYNFVNIKLYFLQT